MAGKNERERKRARERHEQRRQERLQRQRKIRQRTGIGLAVLLVAGLVAGLALAFAGGSGSAAAGKPTAKPTASASASSSTSAAAVTEPAHHCTYTKSGTAAKTVSLPTSSPDYTASYTATINTNLGKININLLNSKATCTVNSFVHLASARFWNDSQCHRVVTTSGLYVLQCGDPYAKSGAKLTCAQAAGAPGTGGPGYVFTSENLTGAKYTTGTVAMANTGTSDSNGSQFFLVYKNSTLPAQYTPFGTITSGLDILQKVAKAGTTCNYSGAGDGAPKEKVVIDSVTIHRT
ncbi:MAG TPA: peptidylprolyl isomerase [Trebonia sp.]|nr:peptidylprolyl isomerase [Trebonia sp.]